jgi:hypothetical protein
VTRGAALSVGDRERVRKKEWKGKTCEREQSKEDKSFVLRRGGGKVALGCNRND